MSKALVEKANQEIALNEGFGMENILSEDLRLPKILLTQQMSKFVTDDNVKARAGELRESFEGRLLGDSKTPVQIIPFYTTNTWTVKKEINGKFEFDKVEPRTATDSQREFEEKGKDGITRRNYRTLNIFCIIRGGNLSIPYMVSMQSFSFKLAAQKFLNKGNILKAEGKAYANRVFNLSSQVVENDKGKFFAYSIETATKDGKEVESTNEELTAAYKQYKGISTALSKGASINMDDLDVTESATSSDAF